MHSAHRLTTAITVASFLFAAPAVFGQEAGKGKIAQPQASPAEQEMMKKWMEISTPAAAHKKLNDLAGTWNVEMKMWMGGPEKQSSTTKGTAVNSWVIGGRFLRQEYKGEMMGMPFEGIGYTGYDNYNKKYVSFWIDNSTTQMTTMSGAVDRSGTVFTFFGAMDEWMTGENGKTAKYVVRVVGKDKHIFEVHDMSIGEPNTKVMEATYTRAQ